MLKKIKHRLLSLRLHSIRVLCFHHICKAYDAESMNQGDWEDIEVFKEYILSMRQEGFKFISLTEAYRHISEDKVRWNNYMVITIDDGYASLKEVLPWLEEQHIPVTLFINGKYLDGKSYRKNLREKYLTKEELWDLTSPLVEIGSHGWEHKDTTLMTLEQFESSVQENMLLLSTHPRYAPFYAYPYGRRTASENQYLQDIGLIPVLVDGKMNYNDNQYIQRELLKI